MSLRTHLGPSSQEIPMSALSASKTCRKISAHDYYNLDSDKAIKLLNDTNESFLYNSSSRSLCSPLIILQGDQS